MSSPIAKVSKPVKPTAMQLFHEDMIEGMPVKCFASHWRIIIRVRIHPNGQSIEITCSSKKLCENTLEQLMQMAVGEAMKYMPEATSLSPKKIKL